MTPYQEYIAKSRYARYLDDKGRREHWEETVRRYMQFMTKHLEQQHKYQIPTALSNELFAAIRDREVLPSMRSIMTALMVILHDG